MAKKRLDHVDKRAAEELVERVYAILGESSHQMALYYDIDPVDALRFLSVSRRCQKARQILDLDVRQAARRAGVPLFRIRAVESGQFSEMSAEATSQYLALLDLDRWYRSWAKRNQDLVERYDLPGG